MTGDPIDLYGRRIAAGKRDVGGRQRPATLASCPARAHPPDAAQLDGQMLAGPAQTWREAAEKCRFLLEGYASTSASQGRPDPKTHRARSWRHRAPQESRGGEN